MNLQRRLWSPSVGLELMAGRTNANLSATGFLGIKSTLHDECD